MHKRGAHPPHLLSLMHFVEFHALASHFVKNIIDDGGYGLKSLLNSQFKTGAQSQHRALVVPRQSGHRQNDRCEADGTTSVHDAFITHARCVLTGGVCSYSLGITARKEMAQCTAKDLIGTHVGDTEDNVKKILNEARGGVLLIDEARN